jgi:hypothetical protein
VSRSLTTSLFARKAVGRITALIGLAATFCAFAVFGQAQVQSPPASAKLASMDVSGSTKISPAELSAACGLKVGDIVSKDDLQRAADKLGKTGLFSAINYHYNTDASGVHLIFEVKDAAGIPVVFDNFPWFTDDELAGAIRGALGTFDGTAPQEGDALDAMSAAIEKFLPSKGIHGKVQHTMIEWPDNSGSVMQFSIMDDPVILRGITFSDPLASKSLAVTAQLSDIVGHPYSRLAISLYAFEEVRPVYLEAGYLKVSFGTPTWTFTRSPSGAQDDSVRAVLPIQLGPQFHFGGITWAGNVAYSNFALSSMLALKPDSVADGNKLLATWTVIENAYGHIGYLDALVDPKPTFDDAAGKVNYQVQITEGAQYHMGDLIITGLSLDGEKRLRAAWTIAPGAVFDQAYFDNFVSKIGKPTEAIFGNVPVHYEKLGKLPRKNEEKHVVDVLLDFQ